MATKIRLQRHGRSKRPYYYIVVADSRARRDGRFIDRIGDYNPLTKPATINLDVDRAVDWVVKGAEITAFREENPSISASSISRSYLPAKS